MAAAAPDPEHMTQAAAAPDPEQVSSALRRGLAGRFPGGITDAEAPARISGGFDFWVYGLHFAGSGLPGQWTAPVVARICARPQRFPLLERESHLQAWVATHGYPAPPVLDLVPPGELLELPSGSCPGWRTAPRPSATAISTPRMCWPGREAGSGGA